MCVLVQIATYVQAVNDIYDKVEFDKIEVINFKVKSLRVRTPGTASVSNSFLMSDNTTLC